MDDRFRGNPPVPTGAFRGRELLVRDLEDSVGLAIEGALERFAARGPRLLRLAGGTFAINTPPRFDI